MTIAMPLTKRRLAARTVVVLLALVSAMPVVAQVNDQQDMPLQPLPSQASTTSSSGAGRVAGSVVGVVGQRQARGEGTAYIQPMARIASRIQNRVQNRIHNRIDRSYDPQSNAASPFAVAEDQVRTSTGQRR